MKDSLDLSAISPGLSDSSSLKHVCSNEISIRNQPYIITMSVHNSKQAQMDLEVEAKESADQWKASFDATAIETMTAKTGNFKSFSVFVNMLENAINQESTSVNIDLFTYDDLEALRKKRQGHSENLTHHQPTNVQLANKRYLILTYNAEYDRIYYPLSLPYCGKPDPVVLMQQIRQLTNENRLLKSRLESDIERSDIIRLQRECARLKKENTDFRQQLSSNRSSSNSNEQQQQQIDLLRQMVRASEDALTKERTKATKTEDYRVLNDQVESLKSSERQLKSKVRSLTNEIALLKRSTLHHPTTVRSSSRERSLQLNGYSPRSSQQQQRPPSSSRPSSGGDQRRPRSDHLLPTLSSRNRSKHRSTSNDSRRSGSETRQRSTSITKRSSSPADSRGRFNPTAYIRERNLKLRQIELQKSREARRRRSAGRRGSDSDMSDFSVRGGSKAGSIASLRLNDSDDGLRTSGSRRSSARKQSSGYKPKDSTDSDMEGVSSPAVLRKAASNNTTGFVPYKSQHQQNVDPTKVELANANDMIDIDERLKSLEKFMKENLPS